MSGDGAQPVASIPDAWRAWAAENLLLGMAPERVGERLRAEGFAAEAVAAEVAAARAHPYLAAGQRVGGVLRRREWLLTTLDRLAALDPGYLALDRRAPPPFAEFLRDYYARSRPLLLEGAVEHWPARTRWTPADLRERFGAVEVEVQRGRAGDPRYEEHGPRYKARLPLAEYVDLVLGCGASNDLYMTANNSAVNNAGLAALFGEVGDVGDGYLDPARTAREGFLWFGPRGTITPLHHDLTNNLFVQVHGRKRIHLAPAAQAPWMHNYTHVYSLVDLARPDLARFPNFAQVKTIAVDLGPGDALFIPVGWWHHVEALDVSISLSFTNFRAPNEFPLHGTQAG